MRFKVDENLHADVADLLRQHGHDALTVSDQGMRGHSDGNVAAVCQQEGRALLTLDLDFSDVRAYPPQDHPGLIVLRLADQSRPSLVGVVQRILPLFATEPLDHCLWIVTEQRVRIRAGDNP